MITVFVNPAAGNAAGAEAALQKTNQFDVRTVRADELRGAVQESIAQGAARIAVAGGDGTVAAVAAAIANSDIELAVIPGGTLNHFARDHGIPVDPVEACRVAICGQTRRIDVGWVNDRLFLNTSSVGVYANYVRVRELHERRVGYWAASVWAIARTFIRFQPFQVSFESDDVQRTYTTPLVFLAVGERELKLPRLGGRLANGRSGLHVMVVRGHTRARLVALSLAGAARGIGAVSRTPHLDSFVVPRCNIEQRHSTVAVDGEIVTLTSPLRYELGVGALRLVVPPKA